MIIEYIGIAKEKRYGGIGSEVLKWIIGFGRNKFSQKIGCRYIILHAKQAISFYKKNGFNVAEFKNSSSSFYLMYRDLFPECVKLEQSN
jgi:Acetyltransferase (GNAT) family